MATYKGMIRLKCVDLSNWASREGLFADVKSTDPIRYSTEGMDTVNVYVEKCDSLETLQTELSEAMAVAYEKFSGMNEDFDELMSELKTVLDAKVEKQSFAMQLRQPYPFYVEVVIKVVE